MFLSKKWIIIVISVTAIAFVILLIIQFGWIRTSIQVNRRHFIDKMMIVSNRAKDAFLCDKPLYNAWLSGSPGRHELFMGDRSVQDLEKIIRYKLDSVLKQEEMPLSSEITGRMDNFCYLMDFVPGTPHNVKLDQSVYKLCLCTNSFRGSLDIGFDLNSREMLVKDSSGLIVPSVILILLLIALFAYIIFVINRQKSLAELKNDFINNLTHEFNTPLFSIGLTSNLLSRSEAIGQSDKLKGYVELISREKNRLQVQVDKILRLTAIESGSLILEKEALDVHQLVEQAVASFVAIIEGKGGAISFKAGAKNHFLRGDKVHLLNAFSNLLDNATKYSDKIPEIVVASSNAGNDLVITISDKGIGMSKAEIDMIFDKFYRVKHGDRHDVKGFGLGLSYVKKIVELHGGLIEVKSKPGDGSVFSIHFPGSY